MTKFVAPTDEVYRAKRKELLTAISRLVVEMRIAVERSKLPIDYREYFLERLLNQVILWDITEVAFINGGFRQGKYVGQKYWSEGALAHWLEEKRNGIPASRIADLRHEHVVPRKALREQVTARKSAAVIYKILDRNALCVVVHKDEDKELKKDWISGQSEWQRYQDARMTIFDLRCEIPNSNRTYADGSPYVKLMSRGLLSALAVSNEVSDQDQQDKRRFGLDSAKNEREGIN